jgi:hypothetical protein
MGEVTSNGRSDLQLDAAWNGELFLAPEGGIQRLQIAGMLERFRV